VRHGVRHSQHKYFEVRRSNTVDAKISSVFSQPLFSKAANNETIPFHFLPYVWNTSRIILKVTKVATTMRSFCYFLLAWFGLETPILPTFADKVLLHLPALEYDSNLEIDQDVYQMACVEGPPEDMNPMAPDAQTTESDEECRALGNCHISDTLPGESVSYLFFPNELDLEEYYQFVESEDGVIIVDITARVAAGENATRAIDLQVFDSHGHDVAGPKEFVVNGRGYQDFYDITWNGVQLETSKFYEIYVVFTEGRVNMCSIKVTLSQTEVGAVSIPVKVGSANDTVQAPLPSITWSALEYSLHDGIEVAVPPGQLDGRNSICQLRKDGVHAQSNNDRICRERDESPCSIAFTEPSEFLSYRFEVPQESDGKFDFRVRAAAASGGKMISFELRNATAEVDDTFFGKRFELPHGDGSWDQYHDIHWRAPPLAYGEYFLDIRFLTGHVNLCSTSVMISDTSSTALDNPMEVPGLYSALN
jgi:hypothetical protein